MALLVSNLELSGEEADPLPAVVERLQVGAERVRRVVVVKRSLDARHRRQVWRAVCRVEVEDEDEVLGRQLASVRAWSPRDERRYGLAEEAPVRRAWQSRPIVVGAGPAGLFTALALAEAGARVRLVERGGPVEERVPAVSGFWARRRPLDPENNVVFGEGGAGTFSDGKLYTRRRDGELGYVFRRLVELGADPAILHQARPHLGTDRIRSILPAFRRRLLELGAEIRFHARVVTLHLDGGVCRGVILASGEVVEGEPVVVAAGHSARDTVAMLVEAGVSAEPRPIGVGVRVEHPQALVDEATYGPGGRGELPPAHYNLSWSPPRGRRAHTFCMCPGGQVIPAVNHPGRLVVNGMSYAARSGRWANAALIVAVGPEDYRGQGPLAGHAWQDAIETACFRAAGSDYRAPAQRVEDLLQGRASTALPRVSYPMGVQPADLRALMPDGVVDALRSALCTFDRRLPGFAGPSAVLIAPETRSTSPVRFLRHRSRSAVGPENLYVVGEGAGQGGGIVSCALDGLRAARAIVDAS